MKLISNDLRDGDKLPHRHVFNGMGYDGDNISPHHRRKAKLIATFLPFTRWI